MSTILKLLSQHLKNRRHDIVVRHELQAKEHDPTYGWRTTTLYIETVDFDELCKAIDELGEMIRNERR